MRNPIIIFVVFLALSGTSQASFADLLPLKMKSHFVGEDKGNSLFDEDKDLVPVRYFRTTEARAPYRVIFRDGLLYNPDGNLYDTTGYGNLLDFAIFVMDLEGNFYSSVEFNDSDDESVEDFRFHHSSFFAGGDLGGAGKWRVVKGIVEHVNNDSGHYAPRKEHLQQIANEIQKHVEYPFAVDRSDPDFINNYICGGLFSD